MTDKIQDRLREYGWHEDYRVAEMATEAADYIDKLEEQRDELAAALISIKGEIAKTSGLSELENYCAYVAESALAKISADASHKSQGGDA